MLEGVEVGTEFRDADEAVAAKVAEEVIGLAGPVGGGNAWWERAGETAGDLEPSKNVSLRCQCLLVAATLT